MGVASVPLVLINFCEIFFWIAFCKVRGWVLVFRGVGVCLAESSNLDSKVYFWACQPFVDLRNAWDYWCGLQCIGLPGQRETFGCIGGRWGFLRVVLRVYRPFSPLQAPPRLSLPTFGCLRNNNLF